MTIDSKESQSGLRAELLRIARALTEEEPPASEDEYDALVEQWARLCPHPGETDILFWPNEVGLCPADEIDTFNMSAEAMVEFALSWEPRVIAMRVASRVGGPASGYYLYDLEAPAIPKTRVATSPDQTYETGDVVAVALKGVRLPDGRRVETTYGYGVMSCGEILGLAALPVGSVAQSPA